MPEHHMTGAYLSRIKHLVGVKFTKDHPLTKTIAQFNAIIPPIQHIDLINLEQNNSIENIAL